MRRLDKADTVLDKQLRGAIMADLGKKVKVPEGWNVQWADSSVTLTSKDKNKILKIDSYKVYTMDVRKPDGTFKSAKFNCQSVDEAVSMAAQAMKVHRSTYATH